MMNEVIHLITNRSGDFHHPSMASIVGYTPHTETTDEASLRQFLKLKDTSTDYYVIGAIMAVYAFPAIAQEFKEQGRTFDVTLWRKDQDVFYPGTLVNSRQDAFNVHRVPSEFPVAFEWRMSYLDAQTMLIQLGTVRYAVPVRVAAGKLYVEWPEELGIQGAISLDEEDWSTTTVLTMLHTPVGFPYTALASQLANREDARRILTGRGYMKHFYAAQSSIEKCAITYTALAGTAQYA
jgi:hypothetical protein